MAAVAVQSQIAAATTGLFDVRQPFAVAAVEYSHRSARIKPYNRGQIMLLVTGRRQRNAAVKISIKEKPCLGGNTVHGRDVIRRNRHFNPRVMIYRLSLRRR